MTTRYPYAARLNSFATRTELFWPGRYGPARPRSSSIDRAATRPRPVARSTSTSRSRSRAWTSRRCGRTSPIAGCCSTASRCATTTIAAFRSGAFTNADPAIRRRAIDLTRRGIDETREAGGRMLTIWPGQDGIDHPFQADYASALRRGGGGLRQVAEHAPDFPVSIEYKPSEPRGVMILPNVSATLLAIAEAGRAEPGRHARLRARPGGRHEPGDGCRAGRAAGAGSWACTSTTATASATTASWSAVVHTVQTIELLRQLRRDGFAGAIYFDTFPDIAALDPVAECAANVVTIEPLFDALDRLPEAELDAALERHDAVAAHRLVQAAIFGRDA